MTDGRMLRHRIAAIAACAAIALGLTHSWSARGEATNVQQGKHVMQADLLFGLGENSDEVMRRASVPKPASVPSTRSSRRLFIVNAP